MIRFSNTEIKHLMAAIFIATFVFAFNDNKPSFVLSAWLLNFLIVLFFVSIVILSREIVHKLVAYYYKANIEYRIWTIERLTFTRQVAYKLFPIKMFGLNIKYIPIGIILAIILTLISNGKLFFIVISSYIIKEKRAYRLGHKFSRLTGFEGAKIAASGILINLVLAIIFSMINKTFFEQFILINYLYALFHLIPLSNLAGSKIFFSSIPLYAFITILTIISFAISVYSLSTLLLSVIIALITSLMLFYLLKKEKD